MTQLLLIWSFGKDTLSIMQITQRRVMWYVSLQCPEGPWCQAVASILKMTFIFISPQVFKLYIF